MLNDYFFFYIFKNGLYFSIFFDFFFAFFHMNHLMNYSFYIFSFSLIFLELFYFWIFYFYFGIPDQSYPDSSIYSFWLDVPICHTYNIIWIMNNLLFL